MYPLDSATTCCFVIVEHASVLEEPQVGACELAVSDLEAKRTDCLLGISRNRQRYG